MEPTGLDIDLTDVLYGVVIANAIYDLTLGFGLGNALLGFALVVILDDWVDYHLSAVDVEATPRRYAAAFVLDVAVLVAWYYVTIVPTGALALYLLGLASFFSLQGTWDVVVAGQRLAGAVRSSHWQLAGVFGLLALGQASLGLDGAFLAVGVGLYLGRRALVWRTWDGSAVERI